MMIAEIIRVIFVFVLISISKFLEIKDKTLSLNHSNLRPNFRGNKISENVLKIRYRREFG